MIPDSPPLRQVCTRLLTGQAQEDVLPMYTLCYQPLHQTGPHLSPSLDCEIKSRKHSICLHQLLDSLGAQWMCYELINMMRMNKYGQSWNAGIMLLPPEFTLFNREISKTLGNLLQDPTRKPPESRVWSWATGENTKTGKRRRRSSVRSMSGWAVRRRKIKPLRST